MTKRIFISAVTIGIFGSMVMGQMASKPERTIDVKVALSAITTLAERQIKDMADALAVAAATDEAKAGEWAKIRPMLVAFEGKFQPATIWFARPDGSYFTTAQGQTNQNLKDRPYFATVMKGQTSIGDLVVSKSTGKNTLVVAVPIKQGNEVVGMLGATIYLDKLSQRLMEAVPLPANMVFYALDSKGRVALHSQPEMVFQEAMQMGSPTLTKAVQTMLATKEGVVTYNFAGGEQKAVYQTAPLLGWKFAIRFPAEGK